MKIPTDNELNLAMCEWMGWKFEEAPVRDPSPSCWRTPDGYYPVFTEDLPDYLSDDSPRRLLNEAEGRLVTTKQQWDYQCNLFLITFGRKEGKFTHKECFAVRSATARQRVIAILRTVKPEVFQ